MEFDKKSKKYQRGGVRPGAGRPRGSRNKRLELQEFLDAVFENRDPVEMTRKLLGSKKPNEKLLIRLLEYRYGKPVQPLAPVEDSPPIKIDISAIPMNDKPVS